LEFYCTVGWGTKDFRPDSDIDLAVLAFSPLDPVACWDLAQLLAAISGRDVDLVYLSRAATVLRMQIVATGERFFVHQRMKRKVLRILFSPVMLDLMKSAA